MQGGFITSVMEKKDHHVFTARKSVGLKTVELTFEFRNEKLSSWFSLRRGERIVKITVSVLCQSDRHFLAFSDTTRNERHHKSN